MGGGRFRHDPCLQHSKVRRKIYMMLARRLAHKLPSAASPLVCRSLGCTAHASMRSSAACVRAPHRLLCTMQSKVSSAESAAASRGDSSDADAPVRLYRFGYILPLRALLRVKVVQLALGVGVVLPVLSVLASGTLPTLAEGAVVAAVSGGTIAAAGTMSWYCERIVGELTWRPVSRTLRVSTLTMFGDRRDVDLTAEELSSDGFVEEDEEHTNFLGEDSEDRYPQTSLVPLDMCGKTYIFVWGKRHVSRPDSLADLLVRRMWPRVTVTAAEGVQQQQQQQGAPEAK